MRGFTLLELLVVLALAGLLLAAVPPMISAVMPGTELKTATRDLSLSLRQARVHAISRGTAVEVRFTDSPARYAVGNQPFMVLPDDTQMHIGYPASSNDGTATYAKLANEPYKLNFFPDGSSSGAMLLLSRGSNQYTLNVGWLMGRVTVQTEAIDAD